MFNKFVGLVWAVMIGMTIGVCTTVFFGETIGFIAGIVTALFSLDVIFNGTED